MKQPLLCSTCASLLAALAAAARAFCSTVDAPPSPPPCPAPDGAGQAAKPDSRRALTWPGAGTHRLTAPQHAVVRFLADAGADVPEEVLLSRAGLPPGSPGLAWLFTQSSAWGTLVVPGTEPGTWRLPEPRADYAEQS